MSPTTVFKPDPLLWYDAALLVPPPYALVAVVVRGQSTPQTGYRHPDGGWRVVGKPAAVAWWSGCLPVPYPDPAADARRQAYEARGLRAAAGPAPG